MRYYVDLKKMLNDGVDWAKYKEEWCARVTGWNKRNELWVESLYTPPHEISKYVMRL